MTKKTRRLLFYIFLALFFILAFIVILYSQGYSFNWQKKSIFATGAFHFKSYPKEADIFINNKYEGMSNKLVKRLLPEMYNIRISKTGYYDWNKILEIKSKLVTSAKNILLIKQNPVVNKITEYNIKQLYFSNDKKKLIYSTIDIDGYLRPTLRLLNLADNTDIQVYPYLIEKESEFSPSWLWLDNLLNISWSHDNKKALLSFSNNRYYVLGLEEQPRAIDVNGLIKVLSNYKIHNPANFLFNPHNSSILYFYFDESLYSFELNIAEPRESIITKSIITNISTYAINNDEILYIESVQGEFYKTNFEGSYFKKILDIPFFKLKQNIDIINDEILIIDNDLHLLRFESRVFEKIVKNVESINFSKDNKKLLWKTKNGIGIIWLDSEFEQPLRKKYEMESILNISQGINQAVWHLKSDQHIFFITDNKIKIIELDNRDKRNIVDVLTDNLENPQIFYNDWNQNLYILNKNQLSSIDMKID